MDFGDKTLNEPRDEPPEESMIDDTGILPKVGACFSFAVPFAYHAVEVLPNLLPGPGRHDAHVSCMATSS